MCMYVYVYIHIHTRIYIYIYITCITYIPRRLLGVRGEPERGGGAE